MFKDILYKQKDGVAMGSPLGPTMANVFLSFYEMKWLEQCPNEFKPNFYKRYVDDILFYLNQLNISQNFMYILIHVVLVCLFHLNKKKMITCRF